MDDISFAKEFARRAHKGQLYGDGPYMYHLEQVAQLVSPIYRPSTAAYGDVAETATKRVTIMTVAYLHDVLEDTPIHYGILVRMFGSEVADAVQLITDPEAHNRKERKRMLYEQIEADDQNAVWPMAITVKVADRLANTINSFRSKQPWRIEMYRKEHDEFRQRLFREGMCDDLWQSLDGWMLTGEGTES